MDYINFYEEKLWIILLFIKQRLKTTPKNLDKFIVDRWKSWWMSDFSDENGKPLVYGKGVIMNSQHKIDSSKTKILNQISEWERVHMNLTFEDVLKGRRKARNLSIVPNWVKQLAKKNGYIVKKSATSIHWFRVSGYQVCSEKNPKQIIAGKKFDLTFQQMLNICQNPSMRGDEK